MNFVGVYPMVDEFFVFTESEMRRAIGSCVQQAARLPTRGAKTWEDPLYGIRQRILRVGHGKRLLSDY